MAIKSLNGTFNNTYVTGVYYPNKYEVNVYNYTHIYNTIIKMSKSYSTHRKIFGFLYIA